MDDPSQWQKMMRYASTGTEFIVTFGLLLLGGVLLDRHYHTEPLCTLIGMLAGFGLGLYRMIGDYRRQERRADKDRQGSPKDPPKFDE
jgi:F0F1-type ATP synthase assembly protein I